MKAIVCDKCKTTITDNLNNIMILEWRVECLGIMGEFNLCNNCEGAFFDFLRQVPVKDETKCNCM